MPPTRHRRTASKDDRQGSEQFTATTSTPTSATRQFGGVLKDSASTDKVSIDFPIGHRRRAEGISADGEV
jgi:hypothetical protein